MPGTPAKAPYLDMSGSASGSPSPCVQRRREAAAGRSTRSQPRDLSEMFRSCRAHEAAAARRPAAAAAATISKYNLDSTYQEIDSPKNVDPFGTFRASKVRRSFKEKTPPVLGERLYVNDPFGTMRAARANSVPKSFSSEASNDEVFAPPGTEEAARPDYRGLKSESVNNNNLAVTNELLELLEDFKNKSYSVKEMEIMFDNWRRKASLPENLLKENTNCDKKAKNDLLKTAKSAYSLLKMFKLSQPGENNPKISKTTNAKKFLKASSVEVVQISSDVNTMSEQIESKFHTTYICKIFVVIAKCLTRYFIY